MPAELEPIFEVKLTEVMSVGCPSADGAPRAATPPSRSSRRPSARPRSSSGPGSGAPRTRSSWSRELARRIEAPLLIDADGLNALAGRLELLAERDGPDRAHPARRRARRGCSGVDSGEVGAHRLARAREAAERAGAIVVLKGDDTIVAAPASGRSSTALAQPGAGDRGHRRRALRA